MLRIWLGILSLFFARLVTGFSLNVPSSVFVNDQFSLNWTWLTSEPTSVVVVLNDISKAPDCPKDTSLREGSYVILDLVKRAGNLGLYVKKEATFQTCAWSYTPNAPKPVTVVQTLLAKSDTFKSTVFGTTVTVQPTGTSSPSSPNSTTSTQASSIAGPVIGGVIGGFVFLLLLLWLILFKITKRYRVIQLPADDASGNAGSSDALLMNSVFTGSALPASIGHIHPGVSPFPRSASSVTDLSPPTTASLKGRFRDQVQGSSSGASGSGAMSPPESNSRSGTPVQTLRGPSGLGHKSRPSTDTRDGGTSGIGSGSHSSDLMLMSTPLRDGKNREVVNQ